ncbi:sugar ABC transporter ATP-binding protein [Paenibacillaceae bacterium WGS1546]|uniref:sugar ABC transporter ATP-binding protein n=1 Tax=Cohnella sp. WGS1546 TaxID=3366810 RepID=UPI00372D5E1A
MDGRAGLRSGQVTLSLADVSHDFGSGNVLNGVSFDVRPGEAHALLGMNGAGKSTLLHLAAGVYRLRQGSISIAGAPVVFRSPADAAARGIAFLTQEVDRGLVPGLTVHENLSLPLSGGKRKLLFRKRDSRELARRLLARYETEIDPDLAAGRLSIFEKQMLSIIRAAEGQARYLILDEPTASFDRKEAARFERLIRFLKQQSIGIVIVSHRMHEVFRLSDRISVLRDGKIVLRKSAAETTLSEAVEAMTGGERSIRRKPARRLNGVDRFAVRGLTAVPGGHPVSFGLKRGEIAVFFGLLGSGKTRLAKALFGLLGGYRAELDGKEERIRGSRDAVRLGLAFVPEERRTQGIWTKFDIRAHLSLANRGWISRKRELASAIQAMDAFRIRPAEPGYLVGALSGGNQQKVAIAKWFGGTPRLAILDEPMKGIDVSAKETIFNTIEELAEQGTSVLLLTAEPDDALRVADRIYVMRRGRIVETLNADESTAERLLSAAERGGWDDEDG